MNNIVRVNEKLIQTSFNSPFISVVLGPRRVGKTTLVNRYVEQNSAQLWVRFNMDKLSERQRVENNDLHKFIEERALQSIAKEAKKVWVFIDEAQKCPALFEQIKIIYDDYKDQNVIKFILTGSASLNLYELSAESLAGRVELNYLRPFTLRETTVLRSKPEHLSELGIKVPTQNIAESPFMSTENLAKFSLLEFIFNITNLEKQIADYINNLAPFRSVLRLALNEQIVWGGFPEILLLTTERDRLHYLAGYIQTYLEKDVRQIASISDLKLYQRILTIIAEQTGSTHNDTRICQALDGCARNTLKKYRDILTKTLLYEEVYPYIRSNLKRFVKSPKGYLIDNGLLTYLNNLVGMAILERSGYIGHHLENWFLKELAVTLDRDYSRSEICFWQSSDSEMEVDFVVKYKGRVFPFEITNSAGITDKKVRNLRQFMREEALPYGFYVYNGDFSYDKETHIYFIPVWAI